MEKRSLLTVDVGEGEAEVVEAEAEVDETGTGTESTICCCRSLLVFDMTVASLSLLCFFFIAHSYASGYDGSFVAEAIDTYRSVELAIVKATVIALSLIGVIHPE